MGWVNTVSGDMDKGQISLIVQQDASSKRFALYPVQPGFARLHFWVAVSQ
jgi:hypothetical protein